ncbi:MULTISPECIES: hypothetical protein [Pseudomonas putida group]|uniref:hypothetical protein n=1 Tax=Pseudomonas putida group TaxID=136845 RepID=UPI001596E49F|nr:MULTISPECIES: hypothetical protein [Pseudomonas putida group]MCZ9636690.1 hypothetical protein [Pseudomonas putida]
MPAVKRILLPDTNQSPEHILKGVGVADHLSASLNVPEVIFLVPVKASLTSGSLHNALGEAVHGALAKGKPIKLPSGAEMRCETMQTLQWLSRPSIVIAVYASQKMMDKIDALQNVTAVVAIPWTAGEIDDWVQTWSPQVLGQSSKPAKPAAKLIADPVVEQAMLSLTKVINKAHNILHPSDEEHAKRILRILRSRDHHEPAENIRRWAIKHGWLPKAAERLETLAEKAFALRAKPKLDNPEHAEQSYQRWAAATTSQSTEAIEAVSTEAVKKQGL